MKKARTKLTLNRETIGNLSEDRLSEAAGGGWTLPSGAPTYCGTCVSNCYCATQPCHTETDCLATYRC
jgi:hypothetical protein